MIKLKAIITVGISASGKTTFTKSLDNNWVNVNRDDLRFSITGSNNWSEYKFKKTTESLVTSVQKNLIKDAKILGKNVIISDTNINREIRYGWEVFLKELGYEVEIKHFPIKLEQAWKRDASRNSGVGHNVIYDQWLKYHQQNSYTYTPNEDLPKAVIFDIDGTLAQMSGRSPYDWSRVGEDSYRTEVGIMAYGYYNYGYKIILMSGRDSCCRDETQFWLADYGVPYHELFMRAEDDVRPDTEIKEELFINHVASNYNVRVVVDDRPCMIRTWNRIGVPTVVSVADPYKEF